GWFRQCGLISFTTDVDFGIMHTDYSKQLFEEFRYSKILKWEITLGTPDFAYCLKVTNTDVFLLYANKDVYWMGNLDAQTKTLYR
ncbi:Uncharacterised protein at_DN1038, partial [Pycnogonum litorale]